MTPQEIQRAAALKVVSHYSGIIRIAAQKVLDGNTDRYLRLAICELADAIGAGSSEALMTAEQDVEKVMGFR